MAKSDYTDPFDNLGYEKQSLDNLVGANHVEYVHPGIASQNAVYYEQFFLDYYHDLGFVSPNQGAWGAFKNSFDLSFSFDFFKFGVRNNYAAISKITRIYLDLLTNSQFYFNQGSGNYLLEFAYSKTMHSY